MGSRHQHDSPGAQQTAQAWKLDPAPLHAICVTDPVQSNFRWLDVECPVSNPSYIDSALEMGAPVDETVHTNAFTVVGIELRTSNAQAMETIPAFWQRFQDEAVMEQIPNKLSDDIYAVYTNFEHQGVDNEGTYSLVIGAEIADPSHAPAALKVVEVPSATRMVFRVPGDKPENVADTWIKIWGMSDLGNTYIADYERYSAESGSIAIYVGVTPEKSPFV